MLRPALVICLITCVVAYNDSDMHKESYFDKDSDVISLNTAISPRANIISLVECAGLSLDQGCSWFALSETTASCAPCFDAKSLPYGPWSLYSTPDYISAYDSSSTMTEHKTRSGAVTSALNKILTSDAAFESTTDEHDGTGETSGVMTSAPNGPALDLTSLPWDPIVTVGVSNGKSS